MYLFGYYLGKNCKFSVIPYCFNKNFLNFFKIFLSQQKLLEAALFVSEHLPHNSHGVPAKGLWALIHCAHWVALGELEWIPFAVLRKSLDLNLLGKYKHKNSL